MWTFSVGPLLNQTVHKNLPHLLHPHLLLTSHQITPFFPFPSHATPTVLDHATSTNMAEQAVENNIGLGLFGDDDEEDADHQQLQQQQYQDDLDADDILGLDDDAEVIENPEGSLLMRFCPHDSSMLYPKVSFVSIWMLPLP